jgi:hypothetical protein
VRTLLWSLFAWSAWAQTATVVARTTGESAAVASDLLVGMDSPATVVAGTTGEGAALASDRLFGVSSASHCGGGNGS